MSISEDQKPNDTIINMLTNFKPKTSCDRLFFDSPMKRPASSDSSLTDETPVKKFKDEHSNAKDIFYIGSPREVRRIRADLLDTRNEITKLKKQISHMHTLRKEMEIMYDRETQGLYKQCEKSKTSIEELENQLQSIRKRESGIKAELDEVNEKYRLLKLTSEIQIQELESNLTSLSSEVQEQTSDNSKEIDCLKRKISDLEYVYKAAQDETDAHKLLGAELKKKLCEKTEMENNLEMKSQALQKANLQIKELEFNKESYVEFQQQAKVQQHKLSTYADLERENQRLKDEAKNLRNEIQNKLILEEEVHDLKTRLVNYKEHENKLNTLQVLNAQTEMWLEEFRTLGRTICDTATSEASLPRILREFVERLQQQEINLTSDKIQLESKMATATHEAKIAKDELEQSQQHITNLQVNVKNHKNLMHRLQKKLLLVSGERDSYRKQLDSYERDLTICMNPASSANPGSVQLQTQQERIKSLEKMVEDYRDLVHKLETDLQNSEPGIHLEVAPIKTEQISRLQSDIDRLRNENSKLRERKDQLEIQLEDFLVGQDTSDGRVVHNSNNPLSECLKQRESDKEKLEEEVERLKWKVKNLKEGLEASKLDVTVDLKKCAELEEKLRGSEQQVQRLKDYFKNSMQEFRNVIYMLLGFKIDKHSNSQYKLTSIYADNADDQLCFHLNNDGALDLLQNEFSASLEEMVELHLRHHRSIPVFLSALTMELFNNGKSKTYQIEDDSEDD